MNDRINWFVKPKVLVTFFLLFAALLLFFTHRLFIERRNELKLSIQDNLKAVAELKANDLHTRMNDCFK